MASPAYEQILAVQALDLTAMQLRHRHANHPIRDQIAEIDAELATLGTATAEVDERFHELERQRKRLEDEAQTIKTKRSDIDAKLYDGSVTASKELLALQDEAAMLLVRQTELEDSELELMEQLEAVEGERSEHAAQREKFDTQRQTQTEALAAALTEVDAELATAESEREAAAAAAEPKLYETYESLKADFDGVAVARLVNGGCDGCHMHLSAVAIDRIAKMSEDAVVTCEECGRLLVR